VRNMFSDAGVTQAVGALTGIGLDFLAYTVKLLLETVSYHNQITSQAPVFTRRLTDWHYG
jgi:hypothetical protein